MKRTAKEMESLLIAGMKEAVAIHRGEAKPVRVRTRTTTARDANVAPPPVFDAHRVVAVRTALEVSQPVFAKVLNVSPKLVQAWEQGARKPNGASQRLLQVAEENGLFLVKKMALLQRPRTAASVARRDPTSPRDRAFLREQDARKEEEATQRRSAGERVFAKRATVHMTKKRGAK
jgi:DNA-binding transcriptional regulator YiaG